VVDFTMYIAVQLTCWILCYIFCRLALFCRNCMACVFICWDDRNM